MFVVISFAFVYCAPSLRNAGKDDDEDVVVVVVQQRQLSKSLAKD